MLNKNFRSFCAFYEELRIVAFFFFFLFAECIYCISLIAFFGGHLEDMINWSA